MECYRFAQPTLHTWATPADPCRLVEQVPAKNDPDPKALACYGMLLRQWAKPEVRQEQMLLRFVTGRPVSALTIQYLAWVCQRLAPTSLKVLVLVWDNASWPVSHAVRRWVRTHKQEVKKTGHGVRLLVCGLARQKSVAQSP